MDDKQKTFTQTEHQIGKTKYIVCSSPSERATDSLCDKIKKLIRKDIALNTVNAP